MSAEQLKEANRRVIEEVWNNGKVNVVDELYASNYVRHRSPFPDIEGLEAFKNFVAKVHDSYPDFRVTAEETVVEGNSMTTRWVWKGTLTTQSPTTGATPTGETVTVSGCSVSHWQDGKMIEEWSYEDFLSMLQQLGVVAPIGQHQT